MQILMVKYHPYSENILSLIIQKSPEICHEIFE